MTPVPAKPPIYNYLLQSSSFFKIFLQSFHLSSRMKKVVFIGDTQVGKTSIINYYLNKNETIRPTVGANSITANVLVDGKKTILNIWDTAGQEEFKCLVPMYAKGASRAVIVIDVSNPISFESLQNWIDSARNDFLIPKIICAANKIDLEYDDNQIKKIESDLYDQRILLFRVSAKTGANITELFYDIAQNDEEEVQPNVQKVEFKEPDAFRGKKHSCC